VGAYVLHVSGTMVAVPLLEWRCVTCGGTFADARSLSVAERTACLLAWRRLGDACGADWVMLARKAVGCSRPEWAEALGVSEETVGRLEDAEPGEAWVDRPARYAFDCARLVLDALGETADVLGVPATPGARLRWLRDAEGVRQSAVEERAAEALPGSERAAWVRWLRYAAASARQDVDGEAAGALHARGFHAGRAAGYDFVASRLELHGTFELDERLRALDARDAEVLRAALRGERSQRDVLDERLRSTFGYGVDEACARVRRLSKRFGTMASFANAVAGGLAATKGWEVGGETTSMSDRDFALLAVLASVGANVMSPEEPAAPRLP